MIAVFSKCERDFREMRFKPEWMFFRIRSADDLRGRKWFGIIETYNFWEDTRVADAYECLKIHEPRLFYK